jgi:hypothetical protein
MKTRRKVIGLFAISSLAAITGCSSQESDSGRVKNAALDGSPVLVNSAFIKGLGGWTLDTTSLPVGDGCAKGNGDPSLGAMAYGKVVFGKDSKAITQMVSVPEPGRVTISLSAEVPAKPANAPAFEVLFALNDSNERPSDSSKVSKDLTLSVTTTRANEKITVSVWGLNYSGRSGCSGVSIKNMQSSYVKTVVAAATNSSTSSSSTSTSTSSTTTTTTTTAPATIKIPTQEPVSNAARGTCTAAKCNIGDTGPSGGVVFITPTSPGNTTGQFFEVSRNVSTSHKWGCAGKVLGNSGAAIGEGRANTARILARCTTGNAVREARARMKLDGDGPGIWFLPSTGEMAELYRNKPTLDSIDFRILFGGNYWTSTEVNATEVQGAILGRSDQVVFPLKKTSDFDVKLISAFKPDLTPLLVLGPKQEFKLNDIGPAGGRIFITPDTPGNTTGKYFEAAQKDWSGAVPSQFGFYKTNWACNAVAQKLVGATATAIGTGAANTRMVEAACVSAPASEVFATRIVSNFVINERSDWFLPSKDEHTALYRNITNPDSNVDIGMLWDLGGRRQFNACILTSTEFSKDIVYGSFEREMAAGGQEYATLKNSQSGCPWPVREVIAGEIGYRPL